MEQNRGRDVENGIELRHAVDGYLEALGVSVEAVPQVSEVERIEQLYGTDSEQLAQNAALLWSVAMRHLPTLIRQGPEHDLVVQSQPASEAVDELVRKITNSQKRKPGYSLLATMYSFYEKFEGETAFIASLQKFNEDLAFLKTNFDDVEDDERRKLQDKLADQVELYKDWGYMYLEGVFDDRRMGHEGGDISDFDFELYRGFFAPFWFERMHRDLHPKTESQFFRKAICEARFLFPEATLAERQQYQTADS